MGTSLPRANPTTSSVLGRPTSGDNCARYSSRSTVLLVRVCPTRHQLSPKGFRSGQNQLRTRSSFISSVPAHYQNQASKGPPREVAEMVESRAPHSPRLKCYLHRRRSTQSLLHVPSCDSRVTTIIHDTLRDRKRQKVRCEDTAVAVSSGITLGRHKVRETGRHPCNEDKEDY